MKTIDKKRIMTGQRSGPEIAHGLWPIINIEKVQIEDYALVPPPGMEAGANMAPKLTRFLRLHIDIPLDDDADWTAIREKLVAGKREEAYQWLVEAGLLKQGTTRARTFVQTALQKG